MATYLALIVVHLAGVAIILIAIFANRRWLKPLAVLAGAALIWTPLLIFLNTLGLPNNAPPNGKYRMISSKMHETDDILYVFVNAIEGDYTPRVYSIPFTRRQYDRLNQNTDYESRVLSIEGGEGGNYEVVYVDYTPPDLTKGDVMRGWRAPDPER
ncbi:MAG: hypothetical protein QF926_06155 [Alphaproteobacteria bacterium]|nr:hypothetical protein [Alphaproteobacteria bacterium]